MWCVVWTSCDMHLIEKPCPHIHTTYSKLKATNSTFALTPGIHGTGAGSLGFSSFAVWIPWIFGVADPQVSRVHMFCCLDGPGLLGDLGFVSGWNGSMGSP